MGKYGTDPSQSPSLSLCSVPEAASHTLLQADIMAFSSALRLWLDDNACLLSTRRSAFDRAHCFSNQHGTHTKFLDRATSIACKLLAFHSLSSCSTPMTMKKGARCHVTQSVIMNLPAGHRLTCLPSFCSSRSRPPDSSCQARERSALGMPLRTRRLTTCGCLAKNAFHSAPPAPAASSQLLSRS